jgi:hypothetical protein
MRLKSLKSGVRRDAFTPASGRDGAGGGGRWRAGGGRIRWRLRCRRGDEDVGASFTGYAATDIGVPDAQRGRTLRADHDDLRLFRPSPDLEDHSALVRVGCLRSVRLFGRERVTALLTPDLSALVTAPDTQGGRAVRAAGDEVRRDVVQRRSSRVPQDRRSSSPCSVVIPVCSSSSALNPSMFLRRFQGQDPPFGNRSLVHSFSSARRGLNRRTR